MKPEEMLRANLEEIEALKQMAVRRITNIEAWANRALAGLFPGDEEWERVRDIQVHALDALDKVRLAALNLHTVIEDYEKLCDHGRELEA